MSYRLKAIKSLYKSRLLYAHIITDLSDHNKPRKQKKRR